MHQSMPPDAATPEVSHPGLCNCLGCIAAVACIAADNTTTAEQTAGALESSGTVAQAASAMIAPPVRVHGDRMHCRIDWINRMWDIDAISGPGGTSWQRALSYLTFVVHSDVSPSIVGLPILQIVA
jgi:hypothetical protein